MSNILPFRRPDGSKPYAETLTERENLPTLDELFRQSAPRHRLSPAQLTLVVTNAKPMSEKRAPAGHKTAAQSATLVPRICSVSCRWFVDSSHFGRS